MFPLYGLGHHSPVKSLDSRNPGGEIRSIHQIIDRKVNCCMSGSRTLQDYHPMLTARLSLRFFTSDRIKGMGPEMNLPLLAVLSVVVSSERDQS